MDPPLPRRGEPVGLFSSDYFAQRSAGPSDPRDHQEEGVEEEVQQGMRSCPRPRNSLSLNLRWKLLELSSRVLPLGDVEGGRHQCLGVQGVQVPLVEGLKKKFKTKKN